MIDNSAGPGGTHGKRREFVVKTRIADHPVMKGYLPVVAWNMMNFTAS